MFAIARQEIASKVYFSEELGLQHGSPQGGWTPDAEEAKQWTVKAAAESYLARHLEKLNLNCEVVAL